VELVEALLRGGLNENTYEFVEIAPKVEIPQTIIVYIIGGVTFAEAQAVRDLNNKY
jgi:hypothetical protein